MRRHHSIVLVPILLMAALLAGCSHSTDRPGFGTLNVRMTDAPGDFQKVNLVITQVSVRMAGGAMGAAADSDSTSWVVLSNSTATYDLLTLQNGVFTTIGTGQVPAGHYTQVRLKIGAGSNIVVDGTTYPLTVPSGAQTGLKLIGPFDVPENGTIDLALDFDAARSIILTGGGTYMLKPTVKVMPISTAGAITGQVEPAGTATTIYAIQAPDTVGSTTAAGDGHFTIGVLAAGTYSVAFHPATGYRDTTLTGVAVTAHNTTDVGTVQLTAQ